MRVPDNKKSAEAEVEAVEVVYSSVAGVLRAYTMRQDVIQAYIEAS